MLHRHSETDRRRGLALAERRGSDRGDHDVLGLRSIGELVDGFQADLGKLIAVGLEQVRPDSHLGRDLGEWRQRDLVTGTNTEFHRR